MSALPKRRYTPDEYLSLERAAATKSEYIAGEIFAMSGASLEHSIIAANLLRSLGRQLESDPCQPLGSDMRVQTGLAGPYFYPDVVIVCGEPLLRPDVHLDTLQNPTVIFEILSPATEALDRGEKFAHYRRTASLQEHVLVAQSQPRIERYTRHGDGWLLTEFSGQETVADLPSIRCVLPLAEEPEV